MRFILCINSGSSSLRFALFGASEALPLILNGKFSRIGLPDTRLSFTRFLTQESDERRIDAQNHIACVPLLAALLDQETGASEVCAIGHRVVHGGLHFRNPQRIDHTMIEGLRRISSFAPNHLPSEIALMDVCAQKFAQIPQIACFDTTFHHTLPRVARLLPIPRRYHAQGVQRYGFHGLSYAYLIEELTRLGDPSATTGRVILAHLGSGASMAAVRNGKSLDTSMGFTPSAGLMMGTRSGDLDPGLVDFLGRSEQMTGKQFDQMIHHESGLLGVSEISSDMRELLALETTDVRAAEAVALFCYHAKKWIGSFAAALGGLDTLVFAGGIGENCPTIRARICEGLGFLGIELNEGSNMDNASLISAAEGRVAVRVIRTDEELMMARSVQRVLGIAEVR